MPVTNPQTLTKLLELGCIANDRVNTSAVAYWLSLRLQEQHVAGSLDQVAAVETTAGQLALAMVGQEDPEFLEIIKPLLSASADGKVQQALANGHILCAGRARYEVQIEGQTRHISVATRFLSDDHEVIEQYVLKPRIKKVESFGASSMALRELVAARQPDMAPQLDAFMEQLHTTWDHALNAGTAA